MSGSHGCNSDPGYRYHVGQPVRIRDRDESRHHRAPGYIHGMSGIITELLEPAPMPEEFTSARAATRQIAVYRVRFDQRNLWPADTQSNHDTLEIEVFENWLANS